MTGETDAIGLVVCFTMLTIVGYYLLKNFWTVVLDDRDLLDVFKDIAISRDARIRHVRNEHASPNGAIVENGYKMSFPENATPIEASLIKLGRKQSDRKELTDEHALLVIRIEAAHDLRCTIVNPTYEIRESADVEHFAPMVLDSKTYSYYPHGIVFSDYEKKQNDFLFDRDVMNIQLINLFVNFRFKFIVFGQNALTAVKSAVLESMPSDIEAYHALIHLHQVLSDHQHQPEFQTIHHI